MRYISSSSSSFIYCYILSYYYERICENQGCQTTGSVFFSKCVKANQSASQRVCHAAVRALVGKELEGGRHAASMMTRINVTMSCYGCCNLRVSATLTVGMCLS